MATPTLSPSEPTTIEKMRGLRWSIAGDSANAVFVEFTFFGSVFILFLDALALSKGQIGIVLSLFPFAGLIAPFIAPRVARFGYKRTFITFWGIRKFFAAQLLLTPWVYGRFGENAAILFVAANTALFALCRATAETGKYPWTQEYVPNHVRGKYSALDNVFTTTVGFVAVATAGYVIAHNSGLTGFMLLIGLGVAFGLVGVWAYTHIPGGAAVTTPKQKNQRELWTAVHDQNFRYYLLGIALMTLATAPMISFLPLFMVEEVRLPQSQVVLLQNGVLVGSLLSVFAWGWAADRYGSAPIMLSGVLLRILLPICWLFMPKGSPYSLYAALGIAFLQGVANMGWAIGSARLLFVSVVPPEKKSDYMALYYAWIGVIGGLSQLFGGWILDLSSELAVDLGIMQLNPYTPLFLLGITLPLGSLYFLRRVQTDSNVGIGRFAGLLFRGNPFLAVESMIRYHMAKDEQTAVRLTERLGQARSLLTIEELLESLADPRFNVRFEAIVAIGRTRPDAQLIHALSQVLHGNDPALGVMAAWALGRSHDERAREPLHAALDSSYRSIRAHSARSLGTLGDQSVIPLLQNRLAAESDHGLRIAYASALGQLQATAATEAILALLADEPEEPARLELALALARLTGEEYTFIQLLRQSRHDRGTALAQAITGLEKKWRKGGDTAVSPTLTLLTQSAAACSIGNLDEGLTLLCRFLRSGLPDNLLPFQMLILQECARHLENAGASRPEYALLALHLLAVSP
ncbi:MAG: MFS transporter [Anaerolineae bacterium]|nr:MFS transporter [Anaerolineae bacterium]